jgi:cation:H+ antiporter
MSVLLSSSSPSLLVLAIFMVSLLIVLSAAAWFTRRLEALCDRLDLSAGMLSILSAPGANIPNFVASIVAIANGQQNVGLGIIIGSNIYNLAIILGISALAAPGSHGIHLRLKEKHDVLVITYYAFAITMTTLVAIWLLPRTSIVGPSYAQLLTLVLVILALILTIAIFGSLVLHIVRRPHPPHVVSIPKQEESKSRTSSVSLKRLIAEVLFALVIALGGVIVMVQSGEQLTADMHMPSVLAGYWSWL